MRTVLRAAFAGAALAATAAALAPSPAAAGTGLCRIAQYGTTYATVCFDLGEDGTTVAPQVVTNCSPRSCERIAPFGSPGVETTGFVPNPAYPAPYVDAAGNVRVYSGTVGWLWLAGGQTPVDVTGFCVGEPAVCAS